jgi:hypothetical protein
MAGALLAAGVLLCGIRQTSAAASGLSGGVTLPLLGIAAIVALAAWLPAAGTWRDAALAGLVLLVAGLGLQFNITDDAYISLRYARNFAEGRGLVFNAGERVEGYTCFLWVLLLGWLKRMGAAPDLVSASRLAGVVSAIGALFVLHRMRRSSAAAPRAGGFNSIVLAGAYFPLVYWSFSGMETGLYLLVWLLGAAFFCAYLRGEGGAGAAGWSGVFLVLAMMTRPETYLLVPVHVALIWARERRPAPRSLFAFGAPILFVFLPYFAWRWSYYGYPFPNTYYAKVGVPSAGLLVYGAKYLGLGLVAHGFFLVIVAARLWRQRFRLDLVSGYYLLLLLTQFAVIIYTGADHFSAWRYFVYVWPWLLLLGADDLERAVREVGRAGASRGAVAAFLVLVQAGAVFWFDGRGPKVTLESGPNLAAKWADLGRWLQQNTKEGDAVATPVIGAIGYYCERPIVDMCGLADEVIGHTLRHPGRGPKDHERFNSEYLMSRRPAWIYLGGPHASEEAFLQEKHWLPAIEDLKRFLPDPAYEYTVLKGPRFSYALYRRVSDGVPP